MKNPLQNPFKARIIVTSLWCLCSDKSHTRSHTRLPPPPPTHTLWAWVLMVGDSDPFGPWAVGWNSRVTAVLIKSFYWAKINLKSDFLHRTNIPLVFHLANIFECLVVSYSDLEVTFCCWWFFAYLLFVGIFINLLATVILFYRELDTVPVFTWFRFNN